MTTWSVVEKDTGEKRGQGLPRPLFPWILPRIAFLASLALAAFMVAAVLTAVRPQEPAELPFSERARSAALAATLQLRTAGRQLAETDPDPASGPGQPDVRLTVTLLTTQARALLAPQDSPGQGSSEPSPGPSSAASSPARLPGSTAALAAALADSARQRLADAAVADGGIARLLAAVGTAQLLQASALTGGEPAPDAAVPPAPAPGQPTIASPQPTASPSVACAPMEGTPSGGPDASTAAAMPAVPAMPAALAGDALAAVVRIEAMAVYGYQVALPRLDGDAARSAAGHLARHEAALAGAEALARTHCLPVPPREAGYTLERSFLAAPAEGLAQLEMATLPVYGDLVALGNEELRRRGIAGLLEAGRRAVRWGADPGPLPGLAADPADFPALPAESPAAR